MGITGLLPFLKKASCPVNIREFSGYTVAVDTYCWLHKSSYACAMDLALGNPTDQYVRYTLKYLELLSSCNIKPILVFDGSNLPSKSDTELKRKESKEAYRKKAAEYLLQGNREAAQECFQRSIFVTPKMAHDVMKAARNLGVDCIVAPYEADAQLAYLNRAGYADLVITEDSDLLLFGCRQVIFKLDLTGAGILVAVTAGIGELCCGMRPSQFTDSTLRYMGILSGCDYFSGIPGIGLATAAKILRQTRLSNFRELLCKLGLYTNLSPAALAASIPAACTDEKPKLSSSRSGSGGKNGASSTKRLHSSLIDAAVRAERTFRLQVVFDPYTRTQRRLSEPTPEDMADEVRMLAGEDCETLVNKENLFSFAGELNTNHTKAFQLALGNVDCHDNTVLDTFDPDSPNSTAHHILQKPRSESSLLNHFSRSTNHDSPSSVRPVLGQLGPSTQTSIDALKRPNKDRLRMSIWDKNFATQKVWIHRRLNAGDNQPSVHCLAVSATSPLKELPAVRNAETIDTQWSEDFDKSSARRSNLLHNVRVMPATHGRQLFVPNVILDGLNKVIKRPRGSPPPSPGAKRSSAAAPTSPLSLQKMDSASDILQTYKDSFETPAPRLPDRTMLASTVLSCSNYFPPKRLQLSTSVLDSKEDEIACALQTAIESDTSDQSELKPTPRSPVFHRNPFSINVQTAKHAELYISADSADTTPLTPPSEGSLHPTQSSSFSPCKSPSVNAQLTPRSKTSIPNSPTFSSRMEEPPLSSPTFASNPILQPASPPPPSTPPDDDSVELSPNFLNSHLSQPVMSSVPNAPRSPMFHGKTLTSLTVSSSIERFKFSPVNITSPGRRHSVQNSTSSSRKRQPKTGSNRNSPSTSRISSGANRTLHSYFRQWQFKDTET